MRKKPKTKKQIADGALFAAAMRDAKKRKRQGISDSVVKKFAAPLQLRGKNAPVHASERGRPVKPKQSEAAAREFRLRNVKL